METPLVAAEAYGQNSLVLDRDGGLWSFGENAFGQAGSGRTGVSATPVRILRKVSKFSLGEHGLAVLTDGSLYSWGRNYDGELGTDDPTVLSPRKIGSGYRDVAAGWGYSLALKANGSLYAWGINDCGQLGIDAPIGSDVHIANPTLLAGRYRAVSAGADHVVALAADGTVYTFGCNGAGQLGRGGDQAQATPMKVSGIDRIVAVVAGRGHSLALRDDGTLFGWGDNSWGQLARVDSAMSTTPVEIGTGFSFVGGKGDHVLGIKDGVPWAWGRNHMTQAGVDSDAAIVPTPNLIALTGAAKVAGGDSHSLSIAADGSLWTWGDNRLGQLGTGLTPSSTIPVSVGSGFKDIAVGYSHALGIRDDDSLWAWGSNLYGAMADGTRIDRYIPVKMAEQVKSVAAGKTESVMLKNDKTVWQWGDVIGHRNDPDAPKISPILKDSGYVFVTAGYTHFLGIKSDKSVWAWGSNGTCQLGNGGSCMSTEIPVKIADGFVSVAAGQFHSVGIKENGELWGWGDNEDGQLGVGPAIVRTPVKMGDGFASVEAGSIYTLARKTNGDVVGFGRSFSSDCQPLVRCAPALLGADFSAMAAGQSHFLLLKSDGSVYARGQNYNGQLGDGTEVQRRSLALVVNATLDGFLNLNSQSPAEVPAEYRVPFFLAASGDLTQSIPSLNARIRFKPSDIGQQGAVFVTARVPKGTLPLSTSGTAGTVAAASASAASARNPRESEVEELLQLTWEGWLIVSDGELFPLVTGVFGELLDTLAILEAYDPNNSGGSARDSTVRSKLAGSKFCVGYGSSASAMTSAGQMRMVANVDDLSAATSSSASCVLTAATNGLTVPGVPRKVDVIAGDSSAVFSFTEPVSNGGAPITGYMATCTGGGHTAQASGSSAPLTVANLTNGISYSCSVSATNSAGSGPVTKPVTVTATSTISILPAAPTAVTATEGDRSVSVNFLPAELGTGALLNYSAACTSNRSDYIFGEGAFSPVSVFPLVNGQAYVCAVKAISTAGSSAWSAESTPVIPVDLPDLLVSELTSASSVRAGGGLLVSASVTNRGRGDAVASRVEFRLLENVADQNSPLAGISNNYCDIPPVRPGQTSRCETTLGVPTSAVLGTRYLVAIADSDQQVTESNEANNSRTASAPIVISKAVRRSITPMIMLLLSSLHQAGEATSAQADPWGLLSAGRPVITGHEEYLRRLLGSGAQITASEVEN